MPALRAEGLTPGTRRRCVAAHRRSYDAPLAGVGGDLLEMGRRDEEAPGWVWCRHAQTGREGWVPEMFLEIGANGEARLMQRYDAAELDVAPGDVLDILNVLGGWALCRTAAGEEGWVPVSVFAGGA